MYKVSFRVKQTRNISYFRIKGSTNEVFLVNRVSPRVSRVDHGSGFLRHVSDVLSVEPSQPDVGQPQQGAVSPRDPEHKQQQLAEDPDLPGRADVRVRRHGCPVHPLPPRLPQPDGKVLLLPLSRQRRLQFDPQVRNQAKEEERAPVGLPVQTRVDRKSQHT